MRTIDVDGLPEPVVHAIEAVVEAIRGQFRPRAPAAPEPIDPAKVKAAILARRNASRAANREWEDIDHDVRDALPASDVG